MKLFVIDDPAYPIFIGSKLTDYYTTLLTKLDETV